ncbi:uncharacterized protein MONBRDRAFT_16641 [Monosiga brevicollis MX1]|uniref:Fe2OG dioxygenase domain-containing protein n=1 Tax=Monosiga brevicollis TaxID=81824 RepID=A9UXL8_MONBE|nr:uncharacterized protein MONBRDRAFT_16641 [Monosiga brevicollis MX1]EDQ90032.1 predicted protein [Monosiga brevicollis MX1]|eukprot:XP_001745454.1 hypothetical protein [Monosiga brevicollis MX1]
MRLLEAASFGEGVRTALQPNPNDAAWTTILPRTVLIHSHARLTNSSALSHLMATDYDVIAPLLVRQNKYWSNFWGSASGFAPAVAAQALADADRLGYMRSPDYYEIVERHQTGVWTVPVVFGAVVLSERVHDTLKEAAQDLAEGEAGWFYGMAALAAHLRHAGSLVRVTNEHRFGHMINTDAYDASHLHPDMYLAQDNPAEWEAVYLHEEYNQFRELGDMEDCTDVYRVPALSARFAREMIEECENLGEWSNGQHTDNRLKGGYEPVPTQDIHFEQIGFKDTWQHFLRTYLGPVANHHYMGYHIQGRTTLDFVVRYRPDKQSFLRPHHDASTVTLNVALNQGGVDYQGGGTHFLRQNCTIKDAPPGWGTLSPGRLTHYHEGLKTTAGTRYILVSFIDQV